MRLDKFVDNKRGNDEHIDEMVKILKRDCDKFLTHIANESPAEFSWIYRAVEISYGDDWKPNLPNKTAGLLKKKSHLEGGRNTRLTGLYIQELFNNAGNEVFGWPIRDGVSTGTDLTLLRAFGEPKIFLPIGDYKFVWEPRVMDFNSAFLSRVDDTLGMPEERMAWAKLKTYRYKSRAEAEECQKILQPAINTYVKRHFTDKNLYAAMKNGGEIDFKCTSYYLVLDNDGFYEAYNRGWG